MAMKKTLPNQRQTHRLTGDCPFLFMVQVSRGRRCFGRWFAAIMGVSVIRARVWVFGYVWADRVKSLFLLLLSPPFSEIRVALRVLTATSECPQSTYHLQL